MQRNLPHTLILDLDGVLLHEPSQTIAKKHEFFLTTSFLAKDSYGYNYIVPAYLPEFLHFATHTFNVHFFSAGDKERNRSVIEDIWMKVFKVPKPEQVRVLSREDLTSTRRNDDLQPESDRLYWYGNDKKDITKIGELHNTVLVDDDHSWVLRGQKHNLLKVSRLDFFHLYAIVEHFKDKEAFEQALKKGFSNDYARDDLFTFYMLLYITGILDKAVQHESSIVKGLYEIQFKNNEPHYDEMVEEIEHYKRGYQVLSKFSKGTLPEYFAEVEQHFYPFPKEAEKS